MMLIDDIISLDASINNWYRSSKLPKLIRKLVARNRRKKLMQITYKYYDLVLEYNDIMSFLTVCMRVNPPDGKYMYIKKIVEYISKGETHFAVSMSVNVDNPEGPTSVAYTVDMTDDKEQRMEIKMTMDGPGGKFSSHLSRSSLEMRQTEDDITEKLVDCLNSMFVNMIVHILQDTFNRSERIYEE